MSFGNNVHVFFPVPIETEILVLKDHSTADAARQILTHLLSNCTSLFLLKGLNSSASMTCPVGSLLTGSTNQVSSCLMSFLPYPDVTTGDRNETTDHRMLAVRGDHQRSTVLLKWPLISGLKRKHFQTTSTWVSCQFMTKAVAQYLKTTSQVISNETHKVKQLLQDFNYNQ